MLSHMSEKDDLARLAQDFVDLWQEQVAASAADPALMRWVEAWLAPLAAAGAGGGERRAPPAGAAAPGAPHDELGRRLDELARRLGACEERLAALERKPRKRGAPAAKRARGGRA
jgi:hypothetical protein